MRSAIVSVVLLLLMTALYPVQGAESVKEIKIGIGPNYGYLDYDDPMPIWKPKWDWGITAEGSMLIPIYNNLSIVTGLRYSNIKNDVELQGMDMEGYWNAEHKYLSVPILIEYGLENNPFFVELGPEFMYLLSAEIHSIYFTALEGLQEDTEDVTERLETFNVALRFVVGFKAHQWNVPLAFCVSYHHGLTGIAKGDEWWTNWKTREVSFSLLYVHRFE